MPDFSRSLMEKLMGYFIPEGSAYSRDIPHIPVNVRTNRDTFSDEATGSYNNVSGINVNVPHNARPVDIMDTIRHEMIHKYLSNRNLPVPSEHETTNFFASGRLGNPRVELPAYMAIEPKTINISSEVRDQYMDDLYNFLNKTGQSEKSRLIQHLIQGQRGNQILPQQNVGNIQP